MKKKYKYIAIIILLVAISIGVWFTIAYFTKDQFSVASFNLGNITKKTSKSNNSDSVNSTSTLTSTKKNQDTAENIIYAKIKDGVSEIYQINFEGKDKKKLFSDADEESKIKLFGGLAYLSREILVLIGNDPIGKLEVIKTDGTADKSVIVDSFGSPSTLAISPDGKTIAFSSFSNVEADYGYNIYSISRDGSNRRKLFGSEDLVSSLSWNKDGSYLGFIKTKSGGDSQIITYNTKTDKSNSIYSSSNQILTLKWNQNDKITFTLATDKLKSGEIWICNPDSGQAEKLMTSKNDLPIYSNISSDSLNFNYILSNYGDTFEDYKEGKLKSFRISGENEQKLGDANIILGWLP